MGYKKLDVNGVTWIDGFDLSMDEINEIVSGYSFHGLDIEACMEENQMTRVDSYKDYIFLVLYFPKFDLITRRYLMNELDIFIGKDFLITMKGYNTHHINNLFDKISKSEIEENEMAIFSPGLVLYEIIHTMIDKTFKMIGKLKKEIRILENKVFIDSSEALVNDIMITKRNVVSLKHILKPQIKVLKTLEDKINETFGKKTELYFEELQDKVFKLTGDIDMMEENIDLIEDSFRRLIEIKTNSIIRFLTFFSAFFMPITFVTSFYGMNIELPLQKEHILVYILIASTLISTILLMLWISKGKK